MPAAALPRSRAKHPRSNSSFIRWNKLVNWNFGSLRAFLAMRRSLVVTESPLLCAVGVSLPRSTLRRLLPSSGITRLRRYYEAIRLPASHRSVLPCFGCSDRLPPSEEDAGPPGLPCSHRVMHAMVSDPGEADPARPARLGSVLTSAPVKASSFPSTLFSGLHPFNLTAYGLHACGPTLKARDHSLASKDSLTGGWPTLPVRDSHPAENTPLPGRTTASAGNGNWPRRR